MMTTTVRLAAAATALLVAVGCGRKEAAAPRGGAPERAAEALIERAIEKDQGGKADVDITAGGIKVKTGEGEMELNAGEGVKLPADFPSDVTVYSGAKVRSVIKVPDGTGVVLESGDAVAKVAAAYREKMKAGGWAEESALDAEGQTALVFTKAERQCHVMVVKTDDGRSEITMMVSGEKADDEAAAADAGEEP
ncbi:MAG: hypothetical protein BWZ02_02065 [Lentisphaerae bacterium ADurb.BinA184]|nr:MAG: hypothetical protein BWZ02_02065 [Lentisphaerae bacterium ADurb.BinA184]